MRADHQPGDRLNAHLDARVTGRASDDHPLDPTLAAAVEHFFAAHDTPGAPSGLAEQIWENLMQQPAATGTVPLSLPLTLPAVANGRVHRWPDRPVASERGPSALALLATAAILVLSLGLGIGNVVLRSTMPHEERQGPLALLATPTPALNVTPMLRVTMTAPWSRAWGWVGITRTNFAPGGHTKEMSPASPQLLLVESGTLTLRRVAGDPPILATTGPGSSPITTSSATDEFEVVAGDAVVLPMGSSVNVDNRSGAPAAILWLVSNPDDSLDAEGRGTSYDYLAEPPMGDIPPVPFAVALDRVVVPRGGTLPPPAAPRFAVGPVDYAHLDDVRTSSDGATHNLASAPLAIYVLTVRPLVPSTPVATAPASHTLLDLTLEQTPAGRIQLWAERWRIHPSAAAVALPASDGEQIIAVEAGRLDVTLQGTARTLTPGQPVVVPQGAALTLRNPDPTDTVAAMVSVAPSPVNHLIDPKVVDREGVIVATPRDIYPGGPVHVSLERQTLPVGAALPQEEPGYFGWFGIVSGTLGLTLQGRGLPNGWQAAHEQQLSADRPMPPVTPGTRMTLRNAGEVPLDLYRLEFLPEPPGTPDTSALSG
jgi:quercetin dioxygenase-like cupin family protein